MYVHDSRTLMGGCALMISGAILTSMLQLYFGSEYTDEGIVRSRWWWEIVMNLQVLSLAFMWFCYADRVSDNEGLKKRVMLVRLLFSLLIVLLPSWLALVSAYLNWFVERPSIEVIGNLIFIMLVIWGLTNFVPGFMHLVAGKKDNRQGFLFTYMKPRKWYVYMPVYMAFLVWVLEIVRGGTLHYQYVPLLLYTQAAIPFLMRGLGRVAVKR